MRETMCEMMNEMMRKMRDDFNAKMDSVGN